MTSNVELSACGGEGQCWNKDSGLGGNKVYRLRVGNMVYRVRDANVAHGTHSRVSYRVRFRVRVKCGIWSG